MNKYLIVIVCMMFLYSCSEENNRVPSSDDPTIPGKVTKVLWDPLPGAVKLTYDLPSDQSLSYVKAECLINGVVRQVKATSYVNNLIIEGFADTLTYTVNLYSVSRSEKESEPVKIQVKPLSPPFHEVFKNIQIMDDWGGITIFFKNPSEADLAIYVIQIDSTGFWNDGETFYTKRQEGSFSMRGLKPVETRFGVYLRDRWNNSSDTLVMDLTPRFEKQLDRLSFKELILPSDSRFAYGWVMSNLWNGNTGDPGFHTDPDGMWPQHFSFDMGVVEGALLSRCKIWQRRNQPSVHYAERSLRKFEIYGSMNPNLDGSWESWTLLLDSEIIKPSGLPLGTVSQEDTEALYEGHEFVFPLDVPYVRYIRIKVKETWSNMNSFFLAALAFWGSEPSDFNE